MSADERFIDLWNDYLEGELDERGLTELCQLLAHEDHLVHLAADSLRTHRLLKLMAQQDELIQPTLNRLPAEDGHFVTAVMQQVSPGNAAAARPRIRSLDTWRWIMRRPVSRVSAAAVLVLAVTGVALWFHGGGATIAFADLIAPIIEAKTVQFTATTEIKGPPAATVTSKVMVLDATRMRQEMEVSNTSKSVMIFDWGRGKSLSLDPTTKKAMVVSLANLTEEQIAKQDLFASFRSILLDARDNPDVKREPLGEKEIDGRRVVGFLVRSRGMVVSLWGDPETSLPVRAEATLALFANAKTTMSDFVFNVDMDESLFSVEPPAGYTVENMEVDVSMPVEKDLIETFRIYTDLSEGVFPDSLDMQAMMQTVGTTIGIKNSLQMMIEKFAPEERQLDEAQRQEFEDLMRKIIPAPGKEMPTKEQMQEIEQPLRKFKTQLSKMADQGKTATGEEKPDELEMLRNRQAEIRKITEAGVKKVMEIQIPLQRGLLFVFTLPQEADAHYAGKGITLGAADTPVFWYRPKGSKPYRVIYADLSVREAGTPPAIPGSLPVSTPLGPNK